MTDDDCSCKVGRVAEQYGLDDLDDELRRRYAAEASLRDLEALLNQRVLRKAIERTGEDVSVLLGSDRGVDALYGILREDEETEPGERARVKTRLEQADIDVDSVIEDWVSHATIRTHLTDCLSVDTGRGSSISPETAISTVEWSRSRSENVVRETVERLNNADMLDVTDPTVGVSIRITCEACGRSYTIQDLLDAGGCACNESPEPHDQ